MLFLQNLPSSSFISVWDPDPADPKFFLWLGSVKMGNIFLTLSI